MFVKWTGRVKCLDREVAKPAVQPGRCLAIEQTRRGLGLAVSRDDTQQRLTANHIRFFERPPKRVAQFTLAVWQEIEREKIPPESSGKGRMKVFEVNFAHRFYRPSTLCIPAFAIRESRGIPKRPYK